METAPAGFSAGRWRAADRLAEAAESPHAFLRRETRLHHTAIEAAFAGLDVAVADDLAAFLRIQAAALLPLEAAIDQAGGGAFLDDWPARRRSAALLADLEKLGVTDVPALVEPPLPDRGHLLGALYVLEGSKLGGRVLFRRQMASTDHRVRAAGAFLGHLRAGEWGRFLDVLGQSPATRPVLDSLLAGAHTAFGLFGRAASFLPAEIQSRLATAPAIHAFSLRDTVGSEAALSGLEA